MTNNKWTNTRTAAFSPHLTHKETDNLLLVNNMFSKTCYQTNTGLIKDKVVTENKITINPEITSNLDYPCGVHKIFFFFFGAGSCVLCGSGCKNSREVMSTANWPLSIVGRVLWGFFQQCDVDQSTGQNEEHCHSMSSPAKREREESDINTLCEEKKDSIKACREGEMLSSITAL